MLRTNVRYDSDIVFDKDISEQEYARRVQAERELLSQAFAKIVRGDFCGPMEYELAADIWYRMTVKVIGKRADTMIMMVTFFEISEYRIKREAEWK